MEDYEGMFLTGMQKLDFLVYAMIENRCDMTQDQVHGMEEILEEAVKTLHTVKDFIDGKIMEREATA